MRVTVILLAVVMSAAPLKMRRLFFATPHPSSQRMGLFSSSKQTESPAPPALARGGTVRRADAWPPVPAAGWHADCGARRARRPASGLRSRSISWTVAVISSRSPSTFADYAHYHSLDRSRCGRSAHWAGQMIDAGPLLGVSRWSSAAPPQVTARWRSRAHRRIGIPTAGHEERLRRVITTLARNAATMTADWRSPFPPTARMAISAATAALIANLAQSGVCEDHAAG